MLKTITRLLTTLTILTALIAAVLFAYNNEHTYFSDENMTGNTIGNIYNGGLFCEKGGTIFFSNDKADGSLYMMNSDCTDIRKLRDDKAVFINADENYIYYVLADNTFENSKDLIMFNNSGVFRIKQNGSELMSITDDPSAYLTLKGNSLYFLKYNIKTGLSMYKNKIDGTLERLLAENAAIPACIDDSMLYYADYSKDHNIKKLNLKSFTTHLAYKGTYYYPIFMENKIYYIDIADGNKIYRMNMDSSDKELLVDYHCSTYNITGSGIYLYYQVDDGANNGMYRLNLSSMKSEQLLSGDYKQINVTKNYVFFKDIDNSNTYLVSADGIADVSLFDPDTSDSNTR